MSQRPRVFDRARFLRSMGFVLCVGGQVLPLATYRFLVTRPSAWR